MRIERVDPSGPAPRRGIDKIVDRVIRMNGTSRQRTRHALKHPAHDFLVRIEGEEVLDFADQGLRVCGHELSQTAIFTIWWKGELVYHMQAMMTAGSIWEPAVGAVVQRWLATAPEELFRG